MPLPILDPLSLGALIQGGVGLAKGITGGFQASRARKRLKELEKQEPKRYIASAILERAKEPIAEEFMQAQEMGAQRRTSQGIGALSQGGSRAILGGLPQIADQERMGEMQRAGQYEQARQDALGTLGAAQTNLIEANRRDWMNKVLAQTQQMGAGTQNIMTGLTDIGKAALTYGMGKEFSPKKKSNTILPDDDLLSSSVMDDPKLEEAGIDMDFKKPDPPVVLNEEMPDVGMEEEAGVEMDFGKPKNPFELPNGGLRVPLPTGGTIDIPPEPTLPDDDLLDNPDVMDDPKLGDEPDAKGENMAKLPEGKVVTPAGTFDIPTQRVLKGKSLPKEVDAVFLKKNPTLMSMYYKDPVTGKFKLRDK
jgi:hypothetical protein